MTDVVEIAKARRATLAAEIGKLDNFIRMAEALLNHSQSTQKQGNASPRQHVLRAPKTARAHWYSASVQRASTVSGVAKSAGWASAAGQRMASSGLPGTSRRQ